MGSYEKEKTRLHATIESLGCLLVGPLLFYGVALVISPPNAGFSSPHAMLKAPESLLCYLTPGFLSSQVEQNVDFPHLGCTNDAEFHFIYAGEGGADLKLGLRKGPHSHGSTDYHWIKDFWDPEEEGYDQQGRGSRTGLTLEQRMNNLLAKGQEWLEKNPQNCNIHE